MKQDAKRAAIIMAGGSGERFWPLSRQNHPKQLLRLTRPDQSMLEEAVTRAAECIPRESIFIQTAPHLQAAIREAGLGLSPGNILAEPAKRNTAGCLAYAAAHIMALHGEEAADIAVAVLTADHAIEDMRRFLDTLDAALGTAAREDALVTIGIPPDWPSTGYGYIEVERPPRKDGDRWTLEAVPVLGFTEKPDRAQAEIYLKSGRHFWNSGMFFWRLGVFLEQFRHAHPGYGAGIAALTAAMRARDDAAVCAIFETLENISIDYALMERAQRVCMLPAVFPWDDLGAWPAVGRHGVKDANGNVLFGEPVALDCRDCIVYNAQSGRMALGVSGLADMVVVATDDAMLVVPKDRAEDVKRIVAVLRERGAAQL